MKTKFLSDKGKSTNILVPSANKEYRINIELEGFEYIAEIEVEANAVLDGNGATEFQGQPISDLSIEWEIERVVLTRLDLYIEPLDQFQEVKNELLLLKVTKFLNSFKVYIEDSPTLEDHHD